MIAMPVLHRPRMSVIRKMRPQQQANEKDADGGDDAADDDAY